MKKVIYSSAIMLLFFLIVILSPLRYYNPILKGRLGYSETMEESKKRGVFLRRYTPLTNPLVINDTLIIFINEAWLERWWQFGAFSTQTVMSDRQKQLSRLCVRVDRDCMKMYNKSWTIGNAGPGKSGFAYALGLLTNLIYELPHPAPEIYPIQNVDDHGYPLPKTIGEFILLPDTSKVQ